MVKSGSDGLWTHKVEDPVGVGGLRTLHRSAEGGLVVDVGAAGSGGAWLELGIEAGWGLHWSEENQGNGD